MYNHARTLLMNVTGEYGAFSGLHPGEELIPPDFRPIAMPNYMRVFRSQLFGLMPDKAFMNIRTFQLLQLLDSTDLHFRKLEFDSRITYDLSTTSDIFDASTYLPAIQKVDSQSDAGLIVSGIPLSPDVVGRSYFEYCVTVVDSNTVRVDRRTGLTGTTSEEFNVALNSGLTDSVPLSGSGYTVRLSIMDPGMQWVIRGYLKPTGSLVDVSQTIQSIGESHLLQLFGTSDDEPYKTFRNCWNSHPDFAYKISGLVLAMIFRTEELRNGQ